MNGITSRLRLVAAVAVAVAALGVGLALRMSTLADVAELTEKQGGNFVTITPRSDEQQAFTASDMALIEGQECVSGVTGIGGLMQVSAPGAPVTVMRQPVTANFLSVTRLPLAAGTDFSSESAKEAILGWDLYVALYSNANVIGSTLQGRTVVGVLEPVPEEFTVAGRFLNVALLVPYGSLAASASPNAEGLPDCSYLIARAAGDPVRAAQQLSRLFTTRVVMSSEVWASRYYAFRLITVRGSLIAALALAVVAGGWIAASLTLSVLQGTRVIGIRRAVGASRRAVAAGIVAEAATISALGAVVGVAVAAALAPLIGGQLGWIHLFIVPFAVALGCVAGLVPAWAAARLRPVVALAQQNVGTTVGRTGTAARLVTAFVLALAALGAALILSVALASGRIIASASGTLNPRLLRVAPAEVAWSSALPSRRLVPGDRTLLEQLAALDVVVTELVEPETHVGIPGHPTLVLRIDWVSPDFEKLRLLTLLAGHSLESSEAGICLLAAGPAASVWGSTAAAIGQNLNYGGHPYRIVGVYDDRTKWGDLPQMIAEGAPQYDVIVGFLVQVRRGYDIDTAIGEIKAAFSSAYPGAATVGVSRLSANGSQFVNRMLDLARGVLPMGIVAILLGTLVAMEVVRYLLSVRRHEFGVRRSLGVRRPGLALLTARTAFGVGWLGVAVGCAGAALLTAPVLRWLYIEESLRLPLILLVLVAGLGLLTLLGAWIGWRLSRVAPAEMLRKGNE